MMIEEPTGGRPPLPATERDGPDQVAVRAAMRRARTLAAAPDFTRRGGNPRVGCVLLDRYGAVIAEGHHRGAGTAHAEAAALAAAGAAARDATAVVTLEPCNHRGRTAPCTEALIAAGIRRVIFAQPDPDPIASGGSERLRSAGIEVIGGVEEDAATMINADWSFAVRSGRPRVRLKIAGSLDGRVAALDGSSQWITSAPARADGHRLRAAADAVLVGTGTVLADDPHLTVRLPAAEMAAVAEQPLRAVFGTTPITNGAAIFDDAAETVLLPTRSPRDALADLRGRGVSSVLIEGGPTVATAFLRAALVDEVISYLAPVLLGAGPAAIGDLGISSIGDALRGDITDVAGIGSGADRCVRITTRIHTEPVLRS